MRLGCDSGAGESCRPAGVASCGCVTGWPCAGARAGDGAMHEPDYGLMSYERLMRYALRLTGRRADAEDLVQTAYLRALEHGDALYDQGPEAWSAWLHRTVRNAFIDQCRRRGR